MYRTFDIGKSASVVISLITIVKMTYRNPLAMNQLLKSDRNKGKYELAPLIPKIREVLLNVYQLNAQLVEYLKAANPETLTKIKSTDILKRVLNGAS